MGKNSTRLERLERVSGSEDFPVYAVFPESGEPYLVTLTGGRAELTDFPGCVVKAYYGECSPDSWDEERKVSGDK